MSGEGLGIACSHLGCYEDPETHHGYACVANYCHARNSPLRVELSHQSSTCLTVDWVKCHHYQTTLGNGVGARPTDNPLPWTTRVRRPITWAVFGVALIIVGLLASLVGVRWEAWTYKPPLPPSTPGPMQTHPILGTEQAGAPSLLVISSQAVTSTAISDQDFVPGLTLSPNPAPIRANSPTPSLSQVSATPDQPTQAPSSTHSPTPSPSPTVIASSRPTQTPSPTSTPSSTPAPTLTPSQVPPPTLLPSPTAIDGRWQVIHVVQTLETLTRIADRYASSVDAIVEANSLDNPDVIVRGQILMVPVVSSNIALQAAPVLTGTKEANPIAPAPKLSLPDSLSPGDGLTLYGPVVFRWQWGRRLKANQYFALLLWRAEQKSPCFLFLTTGRSHRIQPDNYPPADYSWTVRVAEASQYGSRMILRRFLSPAGEPSSFTWTAGPDS